MPLTTALLVSLAAGAAGDRLLLCRPVVAGDPALARPEAVLEAGRTFGREALDYGVPCESPAEAARAAGRAGLALAVSSLATGTGEGSRYSLVLTTSDEEELARRTLQVPTGVDPVPPLTDALRGLRREAGSERPGWARPTAWTLLAGGTAAVVAGVVFAAQARDYARQADAATSPEAWQEAQSAWETRRTWSAVALGMGAAALVGGAVVWFAF